MKIKDIVSLEKDFHPVFDVKSETSGYWRRFIANEQFITILDKVITSVSSKEDKLRKSIWIQGSYGTGKSHSAAVIKHLLWDDITIPENLDYLEREIKNPDISARLKNLRKEKRFLPVVIKGAEAAADHNTMVFTIQKAVRKTLMELGHSITVKTDFENFIYQVEDGILDFNKCIHENAELSLYVKNEKDILKELKNENVNFLNILSKALSKKRTFISAVDIEQWLKDVLKNIRSNKIADGIIIYWDEFTSILDKNDSSIINQIQGIAELSKEENIFLYLISHRMPSAIDSTRGSEDIKKIEDRFYRLQYNMEPTTTYHILTKAIKKKDEKTFYKVKEDAYDRTLVDLARSLSGNNDSTSLNDLMSLFPFHPYAAYLLTFIARNLGSTNRSIFDFLYDEKLGFYAYISEKDFTQFNMISADYLWDFFVKIFETPKFSVIVDKYRQYAKSIKKEDELTLRVFKSTLMLNALNSIVSGLSDSNNPLNPSEENILNTFLGLDISKQDIYDALTYLTKNRIIEKNPFDEYLIEVSALPIKEIEKEKQKIKDEYDLNPLEVLDYDKNGIGLTELEKIADDTLRLTEIKFFKRDSMEHVLLSKIVNQLNNEMMVNIAMFFMIDINEKPHLTKLLHSISSKEETKNRLLIYSDEPFGTSNYDKFLDYVAKFNLSKQQGDDQASNYKDNIFQMIREWIGRIKSSRIIVFFNGKSSEITYSDLYKRINTDYAPRIFGKGLDSLSILRGNKNAWEQKNAKVVAEKVLSVTNRNQLETSLTGAYASVPYVLKDCDETYIIDMSMNIKIEHDDNHPITILQKAVDEKLESLRHEPSFNLLEALSFIFEAPYGYYSSIYGNAAVAFVMRKYVNELYSTQNPRRIDATAMKDMVSELLNGVTNGKIKNKNNFNVRFGSKEEMELKNLFLELFPISDSQNITDTRWLIKDFCKKPEINAPLWSLKYLSNIKKTEQDAISTIEDFVRTSSDSIDLNRIKQTLEIVKNCKYELQDYIKPENFKIGFETFILNELTSANSTEEDINEVRGHIQQTRQNEVALWDEVDVKNIILHWVLEKKQTTNIASSVENTSLNPVASEVLGSKSKDESEFAIEFIKNYTGSIEELKNILLAIIKDNPYFASCLKKYTNK